MSELRTDDLRKEARDLIGQWESYVQFKSGLPAGKRVMAALESLITTSNEIDRLRELVDILRSIPGASITDANYDALADAVKNPPAPNDELRALMSGSSITEEE